MVPFWKQGKQYYLEFLGWCDGAAGGVAPAVREGKRRHSQLVLRRHSDQGRVPTF